MTLIPAPHHQRSVVPQSWREGRVRSWRARGPIAIRLWLPLTPLFLLLAPLVLIGAPLALLTPFGRRIRHRPWRAAWAVGALLLSLSGTEVSVDNRATLIRIRIF